MSHVKDELGTLLVMRCIERLAIKGPAGSGKKKSMESIVFHQCTYGADYSKPAKFLSEADGFLQLGFSGREDPAQELAGRGGSYPRGFFFRPTPYGFRQVV